MLNVYNKKLYNYNSVKDIIDKIDVNTLKNTLETEQINKLIQFENTLLTPIEYAIYRYMNEQNNILKDNLKIIIISLSKYIYIRNPIYFLHSLNSNNESNNDSYHLYKIIDNNREKYNGNSNNTCNVKDKTNLQTIIHDINMHVITEFIKNDNICILDYLKKMEYIEKLGNGKISKIGNTIINAILTSSNFYKIIKSFIKDENISIHHKIYMILMSENINLINDINKDNFNKKIFMNYIKDIVKNGLLRTFYYLIKIDIDNVLNYRTENWDNILHLLTSKNKCDDILRLVLKIDNKLINEKNNSGKTPLYKFAQNKLQSKINIVLNNNITNYKISDKHGNTFLHYLCKNGCLEIIDSCIRKTKSIINLRNNYGETPIILACKNKHENIFYFLQNIGADLNITDNYGNTVYHYICLNNMCCGITIPQIYNNYNYTPQDYCNVLETFYNFINE